MQSGLWYASIIRDRKQTKHENKYRIEKTSFQLHCNYSMQHWCLSRERQRARERVSERERVSFGLCSVVTVPNMLFERTNHLSGRSERNHFMNWFVPFSVQLSSAASMPAGSGTAATHTENCKDVVHVRAVIRSWFVNLLHIENCCWGCDSHSHTVLKVALCHSLTHSLTHSEELIHVQ